MDDIYYSIDEYNPKKRRKILIVFDDMTVDINTNKKFQALVKELFFRYIKVNVSLLFITQSIFSSKMSQIKFSTLFNNENS